MNAPVLPRIVGIEEEDLAATSLNKWLLEYPAATYHADLTAISQGALQWIENSPAHFIRHYGRRINTTPDMRIGTLLHFALLEPHMYERQILQPVFGDLRFKRPKAAKAEWLQSLAPELVTVDEDGKRTGLAPDAPVMTPAEKECVEGMAASVLSSKLIASLLKDAITEATTYWVDPDTGLLRRARLDIVSPARIVLDLKSTEDARKEAFSRRIQQNDYDFQGASYVTAADMVAPGQPHAYGLVPVEREPPYGCKLYMLKPRALARGAARVSACLRTLKHCIEAQTWPNYSEEAEEIDLPEYSYSARAGEFLMSEQTINQTPRTEICDACSLPVLVILSEPDGKPIRLDPQVKRMMRIVAVTALHSVVVPTEVHELHALTCKAINT